MTQVLPERPPVWCFGLDPVDLHYYHTRVMYKHQETAILNVDEFAEHSHLLAKQHGMGNSSFYSFPPDFPPLIWHFPSMDGFLPDLLSSTGRNLCSARLRAAMALPPGVVQWLPLEIRAPDPRVHAMGYRAFRVLAHQPTIDLDRSDVEIEEKVDRHIGGTYRWVRFERRLILRADLQPQTDLFCSDEISTRIYATDALAERVMAAGCLGVQFAHPEYAYFSDDLLFIRTARGVELAGPKARRAHLRRVKQVRAQDATAASA